MRKTGFKSLIFAFTFIVSFSFAQEDESGCKDHPFFTRMPNFYLSGCSESFSEFEIVVGNNKKQMLEGSVLTNSYSIKDGIEKQPSPFQIMKNYENAVVANG